MAMLFMRFLPCRLLDSLILLLCRLKFGDLSKHGLHKPRKGPMYLKKYSRIYPIVDVGTVEKIKSGEIQVCVLSFYVFSIHTIRIPPRTTQLPTTQNALSLSLSHDVATMDRRCYLQYKVSKITM